MDLPLSTGNAFNSKTFSMHGFSFFSLCMLHVKEVLNLLATNCYL